MFYAITLPAYILAAFGLALLVLSWLLLRERMRRKAAAQGLQACHTQLEVLFQNADQGLAVLQEEHFIAVNAAFERLCGRQADALGPKTALEFFAPDDRENAAEHLALCRAGQCEDTAFSCRLLRPAGESVWVRCTARSTQWNEDLALCCFFTDISAQKTLKALRQDLAYLRDAETKTPLTRLLALPRALLREGGLTSDQSARLRAIEQNTYELLQVIHRTLDRYRLEHGDYAFAPGPVPLLPLLDRVREDLEPLDIRIRETATGEPEAGCIQGEALLCYTLLRQCLELARQNAAQEQAVRCTLTRQEADVVLRIRWKGRKEPDKTQQEDKKAHDARLRLAQGIASLHQGELCLQEFAPNSSELFLRLPAAEPVRQNKEADGVLVAPWPRVRILLADTSGEQDAAFQALFKNLPVSIDTAQNKEQALRLFQSAAYDLVFVDMRPPDLGALQTVQAIRTWEHSGQRDRVPAVALVSSREDPFDRSCFEAGCQAVLTKPLQKQQVLELFRRFNLPAARMP